ncbi:hypothetical protein [Microbacterium invictum]|uniref:Vacuolar-type H+-ATPase subunit I/STV1 n=1 Tax=Microbacterium invictum TaxID=515415 RepID=A0AA40VLJ3_9MICO|nr:hypothetical protein [Microbacterium invictum]MBB4139439.1 vacuolar-type H+-ATPase subunit I/STV1 [Microbacterium invictum]
MSIETISIIISAVALLVTLGGMFFAGCAWVIRRIDELEQRLGARIDAGDEKLGARIDSVEEKLGARIDSVEEKLGARIDSVEEKLGARIDGAQRELVELKIGLARLEGPPRHLIPAR